VGIAVTRGASTFGAALGDFENFDPAITAAYTVTLPANGCTAISTNLTGKIALIDRGVCTFSEKIRRAEAAGAVGVLVVNNVAGDPTAMAHDGLAFPTIPAAMLGRTEGNSLKPSGTATVDGTNPQEFITSNEDIIAGFSSRGPTPFTGLIKPDVTAPGVNVYSSVFDEQEPSELGFAYFAGTSMATPHLAGSAALLLDLNPSWAPEDVKSALVNTAARVVTDHVTATVDPGVLARGGGRIFLPDASDTPVLIDPASASFGVWTGNKTVAATRDLTVSSAGASSVSCAVTVTGGGGRVTAPATVVATPAGTTLTLTLNGGGSAQTPSGDYSGDVELDCGGTDLAVPWWTRVDRSAKP
jgi:minor extracellular serine protease Vpr